jgi:hypothetical protein
MQTDIKFIKDIQTADRNRLVDLRPWEPDFLLSALRALEAGFELERWEREQIDAIHNRIKRQLPKRVVK